MKKILLFLIACVATMATYAQDDLGQTWASSFEPVSESQEIRGVNTTVSADGSVYVSSTYNKAFSFGNSEVADPEGLTSSAIVKYNGKGEEQWAATIFGAAEIFALTTTADGTLYATGHYADAVICTGTDGEEIILEGSDSEYYAFVAKISTDGKFEAVKTIAPVVSDAIMNSFMYFPEPGYVYVTPTNIQVDGDKVYVSAGFSADVPELGWIASYVNVWDFMYLENKNIGIFSLNKNDLTNATSVAVVQNSEAISYNQHYAEALNFIVDNGTVYVGFIGFGNLSLTTASGTDNFTFSYTDYGSLEHAFVLSTIATETTNKVFNVSMSDKIYIPFNLFMGEKDNELIIGGTFHGELPFNPSMAVSSDLASDIFIATLDKATGNVNNAYVSGIANAATGMAVAKGVVLLATAENGCYLQSFEMGEVENYSSTALASVAIEPETGFSRISINGTSIDVVYLDLNYSESGYEGWLSSYETVTDAAELKAIKTTSTPDGSSVYVSSTYNKAFSFGNSEVADPEGLTSSCIVKYNGEGKEQWAATIFGAAEILALTTTADGTLYAAGHYMDAVICIGTDGEETILEGDASQYHAFVAKISTDGKFEAVKTIAPVVSDAIMNSFMYFPEPGYVYVTPTNIQVDGDKVYVSAGFSADVPELGWIASYVNVWDFMYLENKNIGIFSLDKNDLTNATSVAVVQNSEAISYNQHYAEALNFVAENGTVYVGFIGFGNLSLTTAAGASDFSFATTEEGSLEHAFVLSTIATETTNKVFNVSMSDKIYIPFNLFMGIDGDKLAIGGTFHGELPFNPSMAVSSELPSDIFIATLDKATGTVNNTYVSGVANNATCMAVSNGSAILSTAETGCYEFDFATGGIYFTGFTYSAIDAGGRVRVYTEDTVIYVNGDYASSPGVVPGVPGDVTGDEVVNVADVTSIVAMILDESLIDNAADVNGDDVVNVADVTYVVSIILGTESASAPARAAAMSEDATPVVSASFDEDNTMYINVANPGYPFTAAQFDIKFEGGIGIVNDGEYYDVFLGSRTSSRNHSEPECNTQPDGSLRVVILSLKNKVFTGEEGDIATVALDVTGVADGVYQYTIKNIALSDPSSQLQYPADVVEWVSVNGGVIGEATGIDSITADGENANEAIYDLSGRKVANPVKGGIYIKGGKKFIM